MVHYFVASYGIAEYAEDMEEMNVYQASDWRNSSSVKLFDMLGNGYDAIRLRSVLFIYDDNDVKWKVDFLIEEYKRPIEKTEEDGITFVVSLPDNNNAMSSFSDIKNQFMSEKAFFVSNGSRKVKLKQLFSMICEALSNTKHGQEFFEYRPGHPYIINAQASHNRTGYGNKYCGNQLVEEGTKYGETDEYVITKILFRAV